MKEKCIIINRVALECPICFDNEHRNDFDKLCSMLSKLGIICYFEEKDIVYDK